MGNRQDDVQVNGSIIGMDDISIGICVEFDYGGRHMAIESYPCGFDVDEESSSIMLWVECSEGEVSGRKTYLLEMPPNEWHSLFNWLKGFSVCPIPMDDKPVPPRICSACGREIGDKELLYQVRIGDLVVKAPLCEECADTVNCEALFDRGKE